jgi:cation/acetate symporter
MAAMVAQKFVLAALFFGPYLRQFGQFTIPELVGARYGPTSEWLAVVAVVLASFVYLLLTAVVAASVASLRLDTILLLVGLSFSLAAATLFPTILLGIFWRRATRLGAEVAMVGGLVVSLAYYLLNHPAFGSDGSYLIGGITPVACGIFGVAFGFLAHVLIGWAGWGARPEDAAFVARMQQPQ